jgi:short-subunit dehydrogenase
LVLVARRKDFLEKAASELRKVHSGIRVDIVAMDLGVPEAGAKLFSQVKALGVSVKFLVNNAGFGSTGRFADLPLDKEIQMIDLNVRTLVELTRLFLPAMLAERSGRILNVGSTAGFQPGPYMSTYYASKAFVNSFSEGLHEELKGTGVSCTVLTPGATGTGFASASGNENTRLFTQGRVANSATVARAGYRGMMAGRALVVPGFVNFMLFQSLRISPRATVRKLAAYLNS